MPYIFHNGLSNPKRPYLVKEMPKESAQKLGGLGIGLLGRVEGIEEGDYTLEQLTKVMNSVYATNQRTLESLSDDNQKVNDVLIFLAIHKRESDALKSKR